MKLKIIGKFFVSFVLLLSQLVTINTAHALSVDFIDNGSYTTDTISGLDWLDVTTSVNQSHDFVSSQFGVGARYEGWRYATGNEFRQMVTNYTGIGMPTGYFRSFQVPEGAIDQLHLLLGSTWDTGIAHDRLQDPDLVEYPEHELVDFTWGWLADKDMFGNRLEGVIHDDDLVSEQIDTISIDFFDRNTPVTHYFGSYLVRPVPIPTAAWLMGSGLLGLLGFFRQAYQVKA